jgi:translation initiation factor IF-1
MSRKDLVNIEGKVIKQLGGGILEIEYTSSTDQITTITAILSGKMKKHRIRVMPGDRVTVSLSPYDLTHGLIVRRL